jgi:two-component system, NarL family, response regulator DesR
LIRVLIYEEARLLRAGLVALLSQAPDMEVVVQLHSSHLVVPMAIAMRPNVAVIDIDLPDGLATLHQLSETLPCCRILTLSDRRIERGDEIAGTQRALGVISKAAPPEFIVAAVRRVTRGERVVDPGLTGQSTGVTGNPLTRRETDVLREAAAGLSTSEIAERLGLSPGTVRNYISGAIAKTSARNRNDAIRLATHNGWLWPTRHNSRNSR